MISIENFLDVLIVQLYWSTFILIGLTFSLFSIMKLNIQLNEKKIQKYSIGLVAPIFFVGVFTFVPTIIISYIFKLDLGLLIFQYFLLISASILYLLKERQKVYSLVRLLISEIKASWSLKLSLTVLIIVTLAALFIGSSTHGDTFVHVAKINLIKEDGFSLADPFFRNIDESRYHFNILYALFALCTGVFKYYSYDIWIFSAGFFTLIGLSAIYLLAKTFIPQKSSFHFQNLTFIVSIILGLSLNFMIAATYPSYVALTALAVFIACLYRIGLQICRYLILTMAVILAMLHTTYAAGALGLVVLYSLALILFGQPNVLKANLRIFTGLLLVLAIPIIITISYPNNMAQSTVEFGSSTDLNLPIGKILRPSGLTPHRITIGLLSLLGAFYLIITSRVRSNRILIICLTLLFALIAYNPIFYPIATEYIPRWTIARFQQINRLSIITSGLGVILLLRWITSKYKSLFYKSIIAVCLLLLAINFSKFSKDYMNYIEYNRGSTVVIRGLKNQASILSNKKVLATSSTSYLLPSFSTLRVVAISPNHASPVAEIEKRIMCQDKYLNLLDDKRISELGADLLVLGTWEMEYLKEANESEYLNKISQSDPILVYEIEHSGETRQDKQCLFLGS